MVNSATNYLNSKGRRIFKSDRGAFYSVSADGKKVYGVKAAYRKAGGDGARVKITAKRNNTTVIPNKIRPAVRSRSDAGKARGPRPGTLQRRMNVNSRRLAAARAKPKRIVGNGRVTTRKVRTNKGVARGPHYGPRKPRSNKGVARGPRPGTLQRRMNTNAAKKKPAGARKVRKNAGAVAKMAKLITPTEDELYRMIFGSPKPRKAAAKKATAAKKAAPKRKTAAKKKAAPKRKAASPLNMILRSGRRTR